MSSPEASHACAVLQARLSAKASELSGVSFREDDLKEQLNDMHAFVEVRCRRIVSTCKVYRLWCFSLSFLVRIGTMETARVGPVATCALVRNPSLHLNSGLLYSTATSFNRCRCQLLCLARSPRQFLHAPPCCVSGFDYLHQRCS